MIGHDVEYQAHTLCLKRAAELAEFLSRADLRIDVSRVGHIVAVRASGPRLQNRRNVEIGNAEIMKIVDNAQRIREPEVPVELQPVCGDRYSH